ncbi:chorismate mutase [Microtetraspora fusca]|uniref:chorismate mutase n=1 Tax=Microtetraspora fusca TaxID=1997 RepID=UPI0008358CE4|nr:chorismate mutase [Microtetraspora fusca]
MSDPTSLAEVRARIDALDGELIRLLADRQALVRHAAAFKADEQAVRAPGRVEQVVQAARARALSAGLSPSVAEAVWRAMIAAFIDLELAEHRAGASPGADRARLRRPHPAHPSPG